MEVRSIVNLTPHALTIHAGDDTVFQIPTSGKVCRCSQENEIVDTINFEFAFVREKEVTHSKRKKDIHVTRVKLGEVENLPEPEDGKIFVVSRVVAEAVKGLGRKDIFIPGPAIRDDQGRIIGADGLSII